MSKRLLERENEHATGGGNNAAMKQEVISLLPDPKPTLPPRPCLSPRLSPILLRALSLLNSLRLALKPTLPPHPNLPRAMKLTIPLRQNLSLSRSPSLSLRSNLPPMLMELNNGKMVEGR
ncbi:uncharacterized protein N7503_005144 [Penicillium pulvis]|uniref:uncharacterized protein n=1 Tax=Penicillium pulvis TaxID=1562058 RepID=UPI002547543D|nr:uncharacterized protein N7503_005144 [Penicillium pulvis]KAJ5802694.1 hypothetical protein N7503_005144 [Penicillium pulvis]